MYLRSIIPALARPRQGDHREFEASLGNSVNPQNRIHETERGREVTERGKMQRGDGEEGVMRSGLMDKNTNILSPDL